MFVKENPDIKKKEKKQNTEDPEEDPITENPMGDSAIGPLTEDPKENLEEDVLN